MITNWRKPSRSEGNGACVELGYDATSSGVRDSKNTTGPALLFQGQAPVLALISAVKAGKITSAR
ncbi:hypothetical protein JOF41_004987 [Saccharothrix coeruleofusca]|uniref:DUF397 domain-containing protein n=1 Tax=Saccharothrix coeruleofusca TaxID=33919 RepID=UPI001AEB545A|nr:DUF397 domain-containing protein [Saccharothrix coeruleofusca]MBP2338809.1 hypothetical protein [Saccharothrix coeruleofusca]